MMRIDIMTIFPELCRAYTGESIIGRAQKDGLVQIECHNIRDYTADRHNRTDDSPYGGGQGMIMTAQPIDSCFSHICQSVGTRPHFIYMSPQGSVLTQKKALELSRMDNITLLCGHYEGVDRRVLDKLCDEEISIGDYVLTGGELPALVLTDTVVRLLDGVLSGSECYMEESHFSGLLEQPQYTRPPVWEGMEVPEILLSGHHLNIAKYSRQQSLLVTARNRPDMLRTTELNKQDIEFLRENGIDTSSR